MSSSNEASTSRGTTASITKSHRQTQKQSRTKSSALQQPVLAHMPEFSMHASSTNYAYSDKESIPANLYVSPNSESIHSNLRVSANSERPAITTDCLDLFDPCTREPIPGGNVQLLEQRVKDIKKKRQSDISNKMTLNPEIVTRLDLLLFMLNRDVRPDESLLAYTNSGQLYESYWDIVFALGLLDQFPITKQYYMFKGKIEKLVSVSPDDNDDFMNIPLEYLSARKINEGSKSGASDITFLYYNRTTDKSADACSSDTGIIATSSCKGSPGKKDVSGSSLPQFFFCSSKYFSRDEAKGVDKFDIQNIYTAAKSLQYNYDRKIILLVKDKSIVEEKLRKAIRRYISEEASYVFGMEDLFAALRKLYDFVKNKALGNVVYEPEIVNILQLAGPPKLPILNLRLHQYIAAFKISDAVNRFRHSGGPSNKFLIGIVPRGGKTFIAGGIIDMLKPQRVVVLLGAKAETLKQFKSELFESFLNFQEYITLDVVSESDITIDPSKKYIFIMSVELYKTEETHRSLLKELKGGVNRADLFICDEAHLKQTTAKARAAMDAATEAKPSAKKQPVVQDEGAPITEEQEQGELESLDAVINPDVPVVYMTGTYMKPLSAFKIPNQHTIIWDYQDIQQAKELATNENYFREIYGHLYDEALATCMAYGQTYESIQEQYRKFPELYLLTTHFTPDAKDAFLKQSMGGFPTLTHLFEVRKDFYPEKTHPYNWYKGFMNPSGVLRLLNYLAPPEKQIEAVDGVLIDPISSVLKSIDNIAQRIGDRLRFFTSDFVTHSQLWFLPHMQGHPLIKRMCALAGAIFQIPWFRKYFHVIGVSSSIDWKIIPTKENNVYIKANVDDGTESCGYFTWACPGKGESLKECLLNQERKARDVGKGLIILAQNMLHLGISLPCVDIVVLLDTGQKIDERIQKMYRALTESTEKKGGYIVDLNYFRTVTAITNYQIAVEESRKGTVYKHSLTDIFNKVLDIFSIDDDKHILRAEIERETLPELTKQLANNRWGDGTIIEDVGDSMNMNIKNFFDMSYDDEIYKYYTYLGSLKDEKRKHTHVRKMGEGVSQAHHEQVSNAAGSGMEGYEEPPPPPTLTKGPNRDAYIDVFKTVLKFGAFGTNAMNIKTLDHMLEIDEDGIRDDIYETLMKRGAVSDVSDNNLQKNIIIDKIIRPGLQQLMEKGKNSSYIEMKRAFEKEDKYPKHVETVLNYINEHLAPKDLERHKYGEVFTPMTLVNEMLDTLPSSVWNNPDLKWLDPANGMGNFPIAVFLRLFYGFRTKAGKYAGITEDGDGNYNPGLTTVIKNEDLRRKHIVKNMLYMVELNTKNIAIAKNLFNKLAPGIDPNIIRMHKIDGFLADVEMKFPNGTIGEFDIVMGNPPFNKGAVRVAMVTNKTLKKQKDLGLEETKSESGFWIKFVEKILKGGILKPNGYLLFIHPITWFKPDRMGAHDMIMSKQITYIKIYKNDGKAQAEFQGKGKISLAYYLLKNKDITEKTQIVYADDKDQTDTIMLSPESILLLKYNSIYHKILGKCVLFKDTTGLKHTQIKSCSDTGPYKLITILEEKGIIKYVNSDVPHPEQNAEKIIIGGTYRPVVYYDKEGEYGLYAKGQRHYFTGSELDKINDYFKTRLSTLLLNYTKYEMDFIKPGYYPDIRTTGLTVINDDTLSDYFGFTVKERSEISKMPLPIHPAADKLIKISCAEIKKLPRSDTSERRRTRKKGK
jgi:hypothetical protein